MPVRPDDPYSPPPAAWTVQNGATQGTLPPLLAPVPSIPALPTAVAALRGHIVYVPGNGTTTADTFHVCLRSSTGTYSWKQIVAG